MHGHQFMGRVNKHQSYGMDNYNKHNLQVLLDETERNTIDDLLP